VTASHDRSSRYQSGAASVRSLADPNGGDALKLSELSERSVIALVGLAFEARIAGGPGVLVMCRGRETPELLQLAIRAGCRSIISFGVAGGLAPNLVPGDCVVASAIIDYPTLRPTDPLWSRKLADIIPGALHGPIVGVNSVVSDPADKCRLHALTGAVAVDMESHLVGRVAASHGLAFAAVRVIIDPAHRAVPPAALLAMAPGGSTDVSAMVWEILAPALVAPVFAPGVPPSLAPILTPSGLWLRDIGKTRPRPGKLVQHKLNPAQVIDRLFRRLKPRSPLMRLPSQATASG
jgi:adenosylhomocysteine nucleosidase